MEKIYQNLILSSYLDSHKISQFRANIDVHKYTKSNSQIQNVILSSHLDSHTRFHMAEQERPGRLTWTGSTVSLHIKMMGMMVGMMMMMNSVHCNTTVGGQ